MSTPAPSPSAAPSSAPDSTGAAPRSALLAWVLFAPLALLGGLRWVLNWQQERAPAAPAWAISPFAGTQDPWAWLRPAGIAIAVLLLLALLARAWARRHGTRALRRLLAAGWLLLWAAACAAQLQGFLNLRAPVAQAPLRAELLGAHARAPSQRSLGGQLWVLRIAGEDAPQQVLVPDAAAAQVPLHARLNLRWARGRWHGRYLSGWDMLPVQP